MTQAGDRVADRYRLAYWVGTGGMGEIWAAVDELLDRTVAIKLVRADSADESAFADRLLGEARAAAAVHHPRVVSIYDVGEHRDSDGRTQSFIVMELLAGRSLARRLDEGPTSAEEATRLLIDVGSALAAAHDRGVIHRDIKPANLMVGPAGEITVLDFGIARAAHSAAMTAAGVVVGTARYLSPEQAAGGPAVAASDVYSLGIVAHQCLTGAPPFDAESDVATALAHITQPPPQLPVVVPAALADLVTRCLAKKPADRPTAAELAVAAAAVDLSPSMETAVLGPCPDAGESPPRWLSSRWVTGYAAAGLALVGGLVAVGLATNSPGSADAAVRAKPTAVVSAAPAADQHVVPIPAYAFRGHSWRMASHRLHVLGFHPERRVSAGGARGHVDRISPAGLLQSGSTIKVFVYAGATHHARTGRVGHGRHADSAD
jgi:serine/threonine-protein kinase